MARQFAQGYLGLQTHGGTDRISYREIQVKDIAPADIPVNTVAPSVTGTGLPGQAADLQPRHVERGRRARRTSSSGTARTRSLPTQPALPRAERDRPGQLHAPRPTRRYGTQALTWTDSLLVGERRHLHADRRGRRQGHPLRGQRRQRRRHGVEDRAGAGDPHRGNAERGAGGTVPATLSLTLGAPASFGAVHPGRHAETTTRPPRPTSSRPPATRRSSRRSDRHGPPGQRHVLAARSRCRRASLHATVDAGRRPVSNDPRRRSPSGSSINATPTRCGPARTARR